MSEDMVHQVERAEQVVRPLPSLVCRRCNRRLSAAASVYNGMGRVCRMKAGVEPEQLELGLFGEEETTMGRIDSILEPMGEEDIASMERWNAREQEMDDLKTEIATLRKLVDAPLDVERTTSCGHTWTLRHTACPTCFAALRARVVELEAELRLADAEVKATPLAQIEAERRVLELERLAKLYADGNQVEAYALSCSLGLEVAGTDPTSQGYGSGTRLEEALAALEVDDEK